MSDCEESSKLLAKILSEQKQTNRLLIALIETLAEGDNDDTEPTTYLSGKPVRSDG